MAKKVKRADSYSLREPAAKLGVTQKQVIGALPKCAPDFAKRKIHQLTKDEVDCIRKIGPRGGGVRTLKKTPVLDNIAVRHARDRATAYHEAGHVVILISEFNIKVKQATVEADGSGLTYPEKLPTKEDDVVAAGLAGLMAQARITGAVGPKDSISDYVGIFLEQYRTAGGDRNSIAKALGVAWIGKHSVNWYRRSYRNADRLVQKHWERICKVAETLLGKEGYPKVLKQVEMEILLKS